MAKFQGGFKEILKTLSLMNSEERERIILEIAKKDEVMAQALKKGLYQFGDIRHLTPKMLVEFLREISLKDFALCFKIHSGEIKDWVMANTPRSVREEIEDVLNGPKVKKSDVLDAENRVMEIFRRMIDKGQLIISNDDEYV